MSANHENRFDDAIRAHHEAAVERISPRVRAQLAQRRTAALRGQAVHRGHGLRYAAAGFAALCALAIGLQFGNVPAPRSSIPTTTSIAATSSTTAATMLDEDPEFYAWLASSDAQQVAME